MKRILIILIATLLPFTATAQSTDTTNVVGGKLDFEQPYFLLDNYFASVKYHLSAEGRKQWEPEFTLRANALFLHGSLDLTAGIRTSPYKVFGLGAGWGQQFLIFGPEDRTTGQVVNAFAYHRHYLPVGHRNRVSLYSDLLAGGLYIYKVADGYTPSEHAGRTHGWFWRFAWQPGIAFNLRGKSNIFLGLSLGTTFGLQAGIAI